VYGGKLEGIDYLVGHRVQEHRGILKISHPMERGIIKNWDDMLKIWGHIYSKEELHISPEEHPVLLTEAPLNPIKNKNDAASIFFETFNAPAIFFAPQVFAGQPHAYPTADMTILLCPGYPFSLCLRAYLRFGSRFR
jgi:centractin